MTRVGVFGSRGRMGAEVCRALYSAPDLYMVAALDLGDDSGAAEAAQVMVDFTHPDAVMTTCPGASTTASTPLSVPPASQTND